MTQNSRERTATDADNVSLAIDLLENVNAVLRGAVRLINNACREAAEIRRVHPEYSPELFNDLDAAETLLHLQSRELESCKALLDKVEVGLCSRPSIAA